MLNKASVVKKKMYWNIKWSLGNTQNKYLLWWLCFCMINQTEVSGHTHYDWLKIYETTIFRNDGTNYTPEDF